ncbi:MAG: hypothetical protein ACXIUD_05870 [Mongoliitalea sp.]
MNALLATAICAILSTGMVHASEDELRALTNVTAKDQRVKVALREGAGKVRISILDENGRYLYQKRVKADKDLKLPFNLSQLPEGEYQVKIRRADNPEEKLIHTIVNRAPLPAPNPLVAFGRILDDNSVRLKVIGLEEPGVSIRITDAFGRNVHSEFVDHPEGFSRIYHLRNVDPSGLAISLRDAAGRSKTILL